MATVLTEVVAKISVGEVMDRLQAIEGLTDLAQPGDRLRRLGNGVVVSTSVQRPTKCKAGGLLFSLWRGDEWRERSRTDGGRRLLLQTNRDCMVHGWFGPSYGAQSSELVLNPVGDSFRALYLRVGAQSSGEELRRRVDGLNQLDRRNAYEVLRFVPEGKNAALEEMLMTVTQSIGDIAVTTQMGIVDHLLHA